MIIIIIIIFIIITIAWLACRDKLSCTSDKVCLNTCTCFLNSDLAWLVEATESDGSSLIS